jgi:APA family basic amino acid/polyamine antiporter
MSTATVRSTTAREQVKGEHVVGLRRAVGIWGSFSWGYADVGADVYVALGLVVAAAQGLAPMAFALTGFVYLFIGLAYTELAAAYPVAGGGHYYTLRGLGDLLGFTSGWALLLDFTIDVSLFALASAGYVNFFFPQLNGRVEVPVFGSIQLWLMFEAIALVLFLIVLNLRGIRESSILNSLTCAVDMFNESVIIFIGFLFAFNPDLLFAQFHTQAPDTYRFFYGASIAIISFVGLESISQAAEETIRPASIVPRTSLALIFTVLIYALSFSTLGLGMVLDPTKPSWQVLAENVGDPVAVLAHHIPFLGFIAGPFTAILAATLVYASANTGVMGYSRITWSMSKFRLLPAWFKQVHPKYRTPTRTILVFSGVALLQVILASLSGQAYDTLGNMYAFGAVTGYILVLISLIKLRMTDPYTPRPYKVPGNIAIMHHGEKVDIPLMAFVGLAGNVFIWVLVVLTHSIGRIAGPLWLILGWSIYFFFRHREGLPRLRSIPRDWESEQMHVLQEAQEFEYLAQYLDALKRRDQRQRVDSDGTDRSNGAQ